MASGHRDWAEVRKVYFAVLEFAAEERARYLADCRPEVRAEVLSLLEAGAEAGTFLDGPAMDVSTGERCGNYRIKGTLGRGGMGIVYRAAREDGEFEQEVAIKVLAGDTGAGELERRFLAERQILARLRHPNIVSLLDGGVERGRRYFVMELVEGVPLGDWARAPGRTEQELMALFRRICGAVAYAHQNLVIHRDLKPSNILVDRDGEPKLLDFGIARLLDSDSGSDATATAGRMMTLAYASPEQVEGRASTVATDIYALGLLLYEMVSGRKAQNVGSDTLSDAVEVICRGEPPRLPGGEKDRRDLDSIIAKALNKDPGRRYGSAMELAADVERYERHYPVLARDATWRYVAGRALRRHWRAASGVAALLVLGAAGVAAIVWQSRVAARERDLAERRFGTARRLARTLMFDAQRELAGVPGAIPARKLLVESGLRYLEELAPGAAGHDDLQREIAAAHTVLGHSQWGVTSGHLGDIEGAEKSIRRSLNGWRALVSRNSSAEDAEGFLSAATALFAIFANQDRDFRRRLELAAEAGIVVDRAVARMKGGARAQRLAAQVRWMEAAATEGSPRPARVAAWEGALAAYERVLQSAPDEPRSKADVALIERNLCDVMERTEAARKHCERALALDRESLAAKPGDRRRKLNVAMSLSLLGVNKAWSLGGHAGLEEMAESVELRRALVKDDPSDQRAMERLGYGLFALGLALNHAGEGKRGLATLQEARAVYGALKADAGVNVQRRRIEEAISEARKSYAGGASPRSRR